MTEQDANRFEQSINRLALALREPVDAIQKRTYFDALADLPIDAVEAAADGMQRTQVDEQGRSFFPTTAQWHHAAEQAQLEQLRKALTPARERAWIYFCDDCSDSGFRVHECRAGERCGRQWCDRHPPEWTHTYVTACSCRSTNPDYRRKHLVPTSHVEGPSEGESVAGTAHVRRRGFSRAGR